MAVDARRVVCQACRGGAGTLLFSLPRCVVSPSPPLEICLPCAPLAALQVGLVSSTKSGCPCLTTLLPSVGWSGQSHALVDHIPALESDSATLRVHKSSYQVHAPPDTNITAMPSPSPHWRSAVIKCIIDFTNSFYVHAVTPPHRNSTES